MAIYKIGARKRGHTLGFDDLGVRRGFGVGLRVSDLQEGRSSNSGVGYKMKSLAFGVLRFHVDGHGVRDEVLGVLGEVLGVSVSTTLASGKKYLSHLWSSGRRTWHARVRSSGSGSGRL